MADGGQRRLSCVPELSRALWLSRHCSGLAGTPPRNRSSCGCSHNQSAAAALIATAGPDKEGLYIPRLGRFAERSSFNKIMSK